MTASTMFANAASAAIAVLVACSSSSSGNSDSYPTCQGAKEPTGAGSSACSSCLQTGCGSQISSVETSCGAYLTCYQGCQCSDLACLQSCLSKIDGACQNAYGPFTTCLTQSCESQCTTTTASDGGTG